MNGDTCKQHYYAWGWLHYDFDSCIIFVWWSDRWWSAQWSNRCWSADVNLHNDHTLIFKFKDGKIGN